MKNKILVLILNLIFINLGCSNYLDLVPEKDIETIESIFEIKASAEKFYYSCFDAVRTQVFKWEANSDPSMIGGGEYAISEYCKESDAVPGLYKSAAVVEGLQNTTSPYVNRWAMDVDGSGAGSIYACIRNCNIFIENIDKVNNMTLAEKATWKAEIMATKAFYYLELIKQYGPIVLVPNNIDANADVELMQQPRSNIDSCFNTVVDLFDKAIPFLRDRNKMPSSNKPFFNKQAAYAMKARALLYQASPLYNGNISYRDFVNSKGETLFSVDYDAEKWHRAAVAADEAIASALTANVQLYKKVTTQETPLLNTISNIINTTIDPSYSEDGEWIFQQENDMFWNIQTTFPKFNSNHLWGQGRLIGGLCPSLRMVEMYYTDKGLPIDKDRGWNYDSRYKMSVEKDDKYQDVVVKDDDVLYLHLRREPRFYAHIGAQGTYWMFENMPVAVNPYKGEDMGTELNQFNPPNYAQNITGYWCKKHAGTGASPTSMNETSKAMLMRLGDLYLMQAEAWNEYSGPSEKVYKAIDIIRERAGLPPVYETWKSFSTAPETVDTKSGMRSIIQRERMIELAFEAQHFWDLRRWKKAEVLNESHKGWNVMGETAEEFYNHFNGPIVVSRNPSFEPRDYFWPIKGEELMISGIKQNPGW